MVHICTTVVGILAALAAASHGKPIGVQSIVANVRQDIADIRAGPLPDLSRAIDNLGSTPDEVTGAQVQVRIISGLVVVRR